MTFARISGVDLETAGPEPSKARVAGVVGEHGFAFVSLARIAGADLELAGVEPSKARVAGVVLEAWLAFPTPIAPPATFNINPAWDADIIRSFEWKTDKMQSPTGHEQRRAVRRAPRRFIEMHHQPTGPERMLADLLIANYATSLIYVPDYTEPSYATAAITAGDVQIHMDTRDQSFAEVGFALINDKNANNYEIVKVAEVTSGEDGVLTLTNPTSSSWPVSTRVYPLYLARMDTYPTITRHADRTWDATIKWWYQQPIDVTGAAPPNSYRGVPIFQQRPSEGEELTSDPDRITQMIDNDIGANTLTDTAGVPFYRQAHTFFLAGRQAFYDFVALLYWFQGSFQPVWLPTFYDDVTLLSDVPPDATVLNVLDTGWSRAPVVEGRRDLYIELYGGSYFCCRITVIGAGLTIGSVQLATDKTFTDGILLSKVRRISFMTYSRLDQDLVETHHRSDIYGVALCTLSFRSVRDET